jgi:hypothetical protein
MIYHRTVPSLLTVCLTPGDRSRARFIHSTTTRACGCKPSIAPANPPTARSTWSFSPMEANISVPPASTVL